MIPFQQFIPFDKLVEQINDTIYIQTHKIGFSFDCYFNELLFDLFSTHYAGQKIVVIASDGENLTRRGIVNFFDDLCDKGIVPRESVTFISHELHWNSNFKHEKMSYGPWFTCINEYIKHNGQLGITDDNARFIGCLIGRFSPSRFKLVYRLDQAFPNDNFLTFKANIDQIHRLYSMIDVNDVYKDQINWVNNKKFDIDPDLPKDLSLIPWHKSCQTYHNLWPKYQIECISETDAFSNFFLTEKTARCIVSAKPFVIVAGKGTLKTLQNFGFKTYGSVIDESYDLEITTNSRITSMIRSLKELHQSPDRQFKIDQLNEIAKYNQQVYDQIRTKI